jgi:hypothetical protein
MKIAECLEKSSVHFSIAWRESTAAEWNSPEARAWVLAKLDWR